jgi:hypothetical protein
MKKLRESYAAQPRDCDRLPAEVRKVEATASTCSGCVPVPCSRYYKDLKYVREPILFDSAHLGASSRSASIGKFLAPRSLLASIGGPHKCLGSVSLLMAPTQRSPASLGTASWSLSPRLCLRARAWKPRKGRRQQSPTVW